MSDTTEVKRSYTRKTVLTTDLAATVVTQYKSGQKIKNIAAEHNLSPMAISQALKAAKVEVVRGRPSGTAATA